MSEKLFNDLVYADPQTGLMWARNGNIVGQELTWENAMNWVKNLNYAGYTNWRLPTNEEFCDFRDRSVICPSGRSWILPCEWFNENGFNNIQASSYWSSTNYGSDGAWVV